MAQDIVAYEESLDPGDREICVALRAVIEESLPGAESKIWHRHPVWFLDGNPTVGYSKLKSGVRLMFWSGADFDEPGLVPGTGKFKDASHTYQHVSEVNPDDIRRWLAKATVIQWDYKNLMKNRRLVRLT